MKAMTLRLPDEIHERLRQDAFDQRTTITALIVARLSSDQASLPTLPAPLTPAVEDSAKDEIRALLAQFSDYPTAGRDFSILDHMFVDFEFWGRLVDILDGPDA